MNANVVPLGCVSRQMLTHLVIKLYVGILVKVGFHNSFLMLEMVAGKSVSPDWLE